MHYLMQIGMVSSSSSGHQLCAQLMTLWKTVLYWLNDLCRPVGHRQEPFRFTLIPSTVLNSVALFTTGINHRWYTFVRRYSEGSDFLTWVLVYLLPNSFWLVFPLLVVVTLWGRIADCLLRKGHASVKRS